MLELSSVPGISAARVAAIAAVVAAGGAIGGYAVHEHNSAKDLEAQNAQITAALNEDRAAINNLTAKVNTLSSQKETQAAQPGAAASSSSSSQGVAGRPSAGRPVATPRRRDDPRFKKLQSQLDEQGKAIDAARNDLASTRGDLDNTRTELTGSIARTHDELVLLEKKGERNYYEFDIVKSKQFQREGAFGVRLKKANDKHQYADLELMVDDRNLTQKHVNLYQPVMFYTPDSPQAVEIVINNVSKDHIHGYVSAPKYRKSELVSMANANTNAAPGSAPGTAQATAQGTATNSTDTASPRQKLPVPQ